MKHLGGLSVLPDLGQDVVGGGRGLLHRDDAVLVVGARALHFLDDARVDPQVLQLDLDYVQEDVEGLLRDLQVLVDHLQVRRLEDLLIVEQK